MSGMSTSRYIIIPSHTCFRHIRSFFQAHLKAKPWRTKSFPLYDDIAPLVEGRAATGEGVFRAGNNLPASQDSTTSDESEPESGDKAPVTDGDDDEEEKEHGENVGVFSCENRAYTTSMILQPDWEDANVLLPSLQLL
jgi:hypothetical protein